MSWTLLTPEEKRFFVLRFLLRAILNFADIIAIGLMGVLGAITATGLSGTSVQILGYTLPSPTADNVTVLVGGIALLYAVKGALAIAFDWWNSVFIAQIEIRNSLKLARFLFSGTLQSVRERSRAEIQFLVGPAVNASFSGLLGAATSLAIEGTVFLSVFVMFLLVDWRAALAIAAYFVVLIYLLQLTTASRYLRAGRNLRKASVDAGGAVLEMVDSFREIAVLRKQDFFLRQYAEARKLDARTGVDLEILKSLPRYIAETSLIIGGVLFIVWQVNRGSLGEGLFALGIFFAGSFRIMGSLLPLQRIWNSLRVSQEWVESTHSILVKLRNQPELLDHGLFSSENKSSPLSEVENTGTGLSIEMNRVTFTHAGKDAPAIRSVSLNVGAGEYVAFVGPSGAGKTTLADLILGLHEPAEGNVTLSGLEPRALREETPGLISYVPQRPGLVRGSIADNVALGVPRDLVDLAGLWSALERAQLAEFVRKLPQGIDSSLGAHSDSLSGGQIQRLGLARALYTDPRLIILDEATSALDAATEASIAEAVKNLGSDTTVVVIAHRLSTIQHADVVYVLDDGCIVASGKFQEVRKNVPMIEEYVKLMSFHDD